LVANLEIYGEGQNMSVRSYDGADFDSKNESQRRTARTPLEEEALNYINKPGKNQVHVEPAKKV
jgi:hypothetical protein